MFLSFLACFSYMSLILVSLLEGLLITKFPRFVIIGRSVSGSNRYQFFISCSFSFLYIYPETKGIMVSNSDYFVYLYILKIQFVSEGMTYFYYNICFILLFFNITTLEMLIDNKNIL
jgi:hypothetical protein